MPVGIADLYRGISEIYCEWGDLKSAIQYLLTSKNWGKQVWLVGWQYRLCIAEARIKEFQRDLDGALDLLDEAERLYVRNPLPDVHPISALKAQIWVAQGKLAQAIRWIHTQELSPDDTLCYLHEFEHITLAKILIAQYQHEKRDDLIQEALGLLDRLLQAAAEGDRGGSVIEILLLQALALTILEHALTLAEPEDYIYIFVKEGSPMAELLSMISNRDGTPRRKEYIHKLISSFDLQKDIHSVEQDQSSILTNQIADSHQPLIEPLSKREIEVLRLLETELSGPEIAHKLMVSLNTVRTHIQNAYTKLGVNNRRAAIRRAEELHLL
jgi:LuxR family maltose regulon positive regulatory protein